MLHNPDSGSVEDRAAACLVLLYVRPVAKIAQLTTDDLEHDEHGNTFLALGTHRLQLVPPLDELINSLPVENASDGSDADDGQRWLFPGKNAGQHIHAASLMRRPNQHGVSCRVSRNTAMLHLAATTPPAVFASVLGIHITTATRWADIASGQWMTYAAQRSSAGIRTHRGHR